MTGEHDAGKGDCPRKVDGDKFRENYDAIFRKKEKEGCSSFCHPDEPCALTENGDCQEKFTKYIK